MTQTDPRFHPGDRWHKETSAPEWGSRVIDAIRDGLTREPDTVTIHTMHTTADQLTITYRHANTPELLGLRRSLTTPPPVGNPTGNLAQWLGAWIANFELIEPATHHPPDADGISWTHLSVENP